MRLRKFFREAIQAGSEVSELFRDWQEFSYRAQTKHEGDCLLVEVYIQSEGFDKLLGIFSNREEAMGAFLSLA